MVVIGCKLPHGLRDLKRRKKRRNGWSFLPNHLFGWRILVRNGEKRTHKINVLIGSFLFSPNLNIFGEKRFPFFLSHHPKGILFRYLNYDMYTFKL